MRPIHPARLWAGLTFAVFAGGCDDGPINKQADPEACGVQRFEMPHRGQVDLLLVIDEGASMCGNQAHLARNLEAFADALFDQGSRVDSRVAVVSANPTDRATLGQFLYRPAVGGGSCAFDLGLEGCPPVGRDPILRADDAWEGCGEDRACAKAAFVRQLRCHVGLGAAGEGPSRSLEAMRRSLSCEGPNAARFGACCVEGRFDPACAAAQAAPPDFLRPDAVLSVVVISDKDDCSAPASNPQASRRVICRPGGTADGDGDGLPDGYADPSYCPDREPRPSEAAACAEVCGAGPACDRCLRHQLELTCFARECGLSPCAPGQDPTASACRVPAECQASRCQIQDANVNTCEWYRGDLTLVSDYYRALTELKPRPNDLLLFWPVVGPRAYTAQGDLITYNLPAQAPPRGCLDATGTFDPQRVCNGVEDCPGEGNACEGGRCTGVGAEAVCCPQGACPGAVRPSCTGEGVTANAGRRLLDLQDLFAEVGFGGACPECTELCSEDFLSELPRLLGDAFGHFKSIVAYCLDGPPECLVAGTERPCASAAEREDPANYDLVVELECLSEGCERPRPRVRMEPGWWGLDTDGFCAGLQLYPGPLQRGSVLTVTDRRAQARCP